MRIEFDDIILSSDSHNFALNRKGKNKKGEETLNPFAFYSTLSGAFEGLLKQKMRQSTATSIKMLTRELQELTRLFRKELEPQL